MSEKTGFTVIVIDNFHRYGPDARHTVYGFEGFEHALIYGFRRVRSSIEQCRKPDQTKDQLHRNWMAMGEDVHVDGIHIGSVYFDRFYEFPPNKKECDYMSLHPEQPGYKSLSDKT